MQNIPRITTNKDIKMMFDPPPGYLLIEFDYGQAELRLIAHLAKETVMLEWFAQNRNIHVATACKMMKIIERYDEIQAITKDDRHSEYTKWIKEKKKGKTTNFGILYGESAKKLASQLKCTVIEAKQFMLEWYEAFPMLTKYINQQHKKAEKLGYVDSVFGRRRRLPDIFDKDNYGKWARALRQTINTPVQGGSSDYCQLSSILIRNEIIRGNLPRDLVQLYTVHDSLGFRILSKHIHKVVPIVSKIMNYPDTKKWFGFEIDSVVMKVNASIGKKWGSLMDYRLDENYNLWLK